MARLLFLFLNCQRSRGQFHCTFDAEQWSNTTDKKAPAITHIPRSGCLPAVVCLWIYLKLPSNSDLVWVACSVPRRNTDVSLSTTHFGESKHHIKRAAVAMRQITLRSQCILKIHSVWFYKYNKRACSSKLSLHMILFLMLLWSQISPAPQQQRNLNSTGSFMQQGCAELGFRLIFV